MDNSIKLNGVRLAAKYRLLKHIDLKDYKDKEGKLTDKGVKAIADRTLRVSLNFNEVTFGEVCENFLNSQTTPLKMWFNNVGQYLTDDKILETVKAGTLEVKVRELLDGRKSRGISDEEKLKRTIAKLVGSGLTKAQILKMIEEVK